MYAHGCESMWDWKKKNEEGKREEQREEWIKGRRKKERRKTKGELEGGKEEKERWKIKEWRINREGMVGRRKER